MGRLTSANRSRARRWAPPPNPRPMSSFARDIRLPDGPHAGDPWLPETEPAQRLWLEEHDLGHWRIFVDVAPSQRGKTLKAILCPTLHGLTEHRQNVGYVMPNLDKLTQNWEGKIRPAIEGAGFGAWLPTKGPGSKGGKPTALTIRDPETHAKAGVMYFMALGHGGRETSLSSVSVARLMIDEADDAESAGQLQLALKRLESFSFGKAYIASTVNDRVNRTGHPILDLFNNGSRSRIAHQCPHCKVYAALEWDQVDLELKAVICKTCAVAWSPDDRTQALNASRIIHHGQTVNADGVVMGERPSGETFAMLTTCLDYHMGNFDQIISEFITGMEAAQRGDHSLAKTFAHKRLCADYVQDQAQMVDLSPTVICKLSYESSYQIGEVSTSVEFISVGVDCQERWHYWKVLGAKRDGTFYHIAGGVENLQDGTGRALEQHQPATAEARAACMDRINREIYKWTQLPDKKMVRRMVDVGYALDQLRPWMARHPEWTAVVGRSEGQVWRQRLAGTGNRVEGGKLAGVADIRRQQDTLGVWILWLLEVETVRGRVHDGYLMPRDQAGAGHLPRGVELRNRDLQIKSDSPTAWWARHLTAEIRKVDPVSGNVEWIKRDGGGRHDLLDATVYAYAGCLAHSEYLRQQEPTPLLGPQKNYTAQSIPREYVNDAPVMPPKHNQRQTYQRRFTVTRSRR
jgi:phage terminase large subunit GpA-like protein